jgi:hypothetical protein
LCILEVIEVRRNVASCHVSACCLDAPFYSSTDELTAADRQSLVDIDVMQDRRLLCIAFSHGERDEHGIDTANE